jgi:pyruvate,water dikinase
LGLVVGIARVESGKMSRDDYLQKYGHRGPHEFELSIPHPAEDRDWLEKQIAEYEATAVDVDNLLQKQRTQHEAARQRFKVRYPRKKRWLDRQLAKVSQGAQQREAARSEFVRVFRVVRAFALQAGKLTRIGDDVFFLYSGEVGELLAGNETALGYIPARRRNYEKYKAMSPFPSIIRGRFDPEAWARQPNRRLDYYDPTKPIEMTHSEMLKGVPGAAGRVEGTVRILLSPEAGDALQPGEVLVAATTNVGWTPLFPKAAAIITDIGAPLSHAAIVARELGIPPEVGCGNATTRQKTGDKVLVDG